MHTALYRTYRPTTFEDVLGQEHIVTALEGAVREGKVAHAYLFSGSRGIGKTSVARIFARAIGTSDKDLYEIDAASNRGIDDIRALREGVHTLPFESPYKVYIIDEVHMLTKEAFNALLKTLEEPPKHVVFILATTEFDKLPETIVSRCQTFRFKKPTQALVAQLMIDVAKKEGFTLEPEAAALVALVADGSFRDAHGALQKVIASLPEKTKKITLERVEQVTGSPRNALVLEFVQAFAEKNAEQAFAVIRNVEQENVDANMFVALVLSKVRAVLLLKYAPSYEKKFQEQLSAQEYASLETIARAKESYLSSKTLASLLDVSITMRQAAEPGLVLELLVMQHLSPS